MLGQELRKARLAAGLTQEEIAAKAKITREYVSLLESGKRTPTVPVFVRICRVAGVSAGRLLTKLEKLDWF